MKKRIIISVLLLIIICTVGIMSYSPLRNKIEQIFFATKVYNLLNSEEYMNLHQVITKDSVNSRTIMWQSLNDREDFVLEYKQENEDEILQVKPQKSVLDIDNKKIYIYAVTLENLKADMIYDYRLGFENNRSNWYKLKTAKENNNKFKALIFPDSQSNDYTEWKSLAMNAYATIRRCGSCPQRSSGAGARTSGRKSHLHRWGWRWSWSSSLRRQRRGRRGAGRS